MITQSGTTRFATLAIVLLAFAAGLAGVWFGQRHSAAAAWNSALFYPEPRTIDHFELTGGDRQPFTPASLEGQWDLLFFGFTHCPDICPNTLAVLADVRSRLVDAGLEAPQVTLISVDPERDDLEKLDEYVRFFDPTFHGATGDPAMLEAFTRNVGIAYFVAEHEPGDRDYTVDHSASILIVDPDGRLVGLFRPPAEPGAIAEDLARLLAG
ncbi:MAG: SCO family protein [Xanthomonadales bacterium]|nr:SCO family protein [Xanthomonadales bacterium]